MIRVLLVEDDAMIREMTRIFLESQKRFEVVCAASGEEALAHAKDPFDVILLDILLPDTNGMQLCQTLRSGHHCPIIFTSCLDDVDTIVHALELGGDDFLTKPYDNKVLAARILANVRRVQMDAAEPSLRGYTCPAFRLDADNRSVHCRGEDIHLADMEYRILSLFVRNPNTFLRPMSSTRRSGARTALAMCAPCRCTSTTCAARSSRTPQSRCTCAMCGARAMCSARKANRSKQNNSAAEMFCGAVSLYTQSLSQHTARCSSTGTGSTTGGCMPSR